jgi:hypothetical protein
MISKILLYTAVVLGSALLAFLVFAAYNMRDRHRGYSVDLHFKAEEEAVLRIGFAALPINPEIPDRWTDINGDARYNPADGDHYEDLNGNGRFDAVWIAGFQNRRPAMGINDTLWARAMVIDDGKLRLALVALDAIGFMHDDVVDVRKRIRPETGITYTMVHSTHSHQTPDLLGLWGKNYLKSGVDKSYLDYVKNQAAASVEEAANRLRRARLHFAQNLEDPGETVADTRLPEVYDNGLRLMQAIDAEDGKTLGVLISWANHPETVWNKNLLLSSDFPHYLRKFIEEGIATNDSLLYAGTGGIALFVNGAIGGLMTTHPGTEVHDPISMEPFLEPSFAKAEAQGKHIAVLALEALKNPGHCVEYAGLSLSARTIMLPLQNPIFKLGSMLGVLNRGNTGWMKMRSEIALFSLGPATFMTFPGEVYPELLNGGVEAPDGQDFNIQPLEVPPIREIMRGEYKFVFGLCNDMIGYIIPKSQWDEKAPFTYGGLQAPYGEINSIGPDAAPLIHRAAMEMLDSFYSSAE